MPPRDGPSAPSQRPRPQGVFGQSARDGREFTPRFSRWTMALDHDADTNIVLVWDITRAGIVTDVQMGSRANGLS